VARCDLCLLFRNLLAQSHQQLALPGFVANLALPRFTILQFSPRHSLGSDRQKDEAQTFERFRQLASDFEPEISPTLSNVS
jgi:hypothetical protein